MTTPFFFAVSNHCNNAAMAFSNLRTVTAVAMGDDLMQSEPIATILPDGVQ
ncbi:MAG: hypothetical protein HY543_10570 [Deltaproteobacteria bacterium]|nr:hypothetical protein [Deltaproteobacteria bacterium]